MTVLLTVLGIISPALAIGVGVLWIDIDGRRQADHPRPWPVDPEWLSEPYAGPNACYGCGLTPEVQNPGEWILCSTCDELRAVLKERAAWPGLMY